MKYITTHKPNDDSLLVTNPSYSTFNLIICLLNQTELLELSIALPRASAPAMRFYCPFARVGLYSKPKKARLNLKRAIDLNKAAENGIASDVVEIGDGVRLEVRAATKVVLVDTNTGLQNLVLKHSQFPILGLSQVTTELKTPQPETTSEPDSPVTPVKLLLNPITVSTP